MMMFGLASTLQQHSISAFRCSRTGVAKCVMVAWGCVAGSPTFLELLQRAKRVVQDAIQHADVPFARVVEAARVPRSTAYTPVFQTMMILQAAVRGTQMPGAAVALASLGVGAMEVRCRDTCITVAGHSRNYRACETTVQAHM